MDPDVDIEGLLRAEGFETKDSVALARKILERQGLTRAGKQRISRSKASGARELLRTSLLKVCQDAGCAELSRHDRRQPVTVSAAACEVCAGSNNRRALISLARCLRDRGVRRVLVLGGKPEQHEDLGQALRAEGVETRCVDGTRGSHSRRDAAPHLEWAQLLVVWGATQLPHKVSRLYTDDPPAHLRVVPLARRGIEALCREVIRSYERSGRAGAGKR